MIKGTLIFLAVLGFGGSTAFVLTEFSDLEDRFAQQQSNLFAQKVVIDELTKRIDNQDQLLAQRDNLRNLRDTASAAAVTNSVKSAPRAGNDQAADYGNDNIYNANDDTGDDLAKTIAARLQADGTTEGGEIATQVREALAVVRAEERKEQEDRRQERSVERVKQRIERISERLNLDYSQKEEMVTIFADSSKSRRTLFEQARSGEVEWQNIRTLMQEQRDTSDKRVEELLTSSQYEEFVVIREEEGDMFGNNRWGRRNRRDNNSNNDNNSNDSNNRESGTNDSGNNSTGSGTPRRRR